MSKGSDAKVLMIYIEPTPYVLGLINELKAVSSNKIDILFLGKNISQNWNIDCPNSSILPEGKQNQIRYLAKLLSHKSYAIIHLAGWGHPLFLFVILFAKYKGMRVVIESDTPIPHKLTLLKRFFKRLLYPILFSFVDLFFPGGKRQADYLKYYGVSDKRICPVNMTVDISRMKQYSAQLTENDRIRIRELYGIPVDAFIFLFVGRLVPQKGLGELIAVFDKMDNNKAILLIVGDGEMRQQIEEAVRLNTKIKYAGRISGSELIEIYFSADTFVLPSHFEPWGLVINEAMVLGKPVIVTDRVGCIDDLVSHGKTGLIIKAQSIEALNNAIEYMVKFSEEVILMGQRARNKIADWTLENEAKKISQEWNRL